MPRHPSICLVGAVSLVLAGCASFEERPLSPDRSAAGFSSRTLHDQSLHAFLSAHRAGGGSWTPDRLAVAGAYFRGDVRVARAEAEQAAARITTADQLPNPVFSFAPGYNSTSKGISPWILTPTFDIPIETAGKRGLRVAEARAGAEAAQLRVVAAAWRVRKEVLDASLDLYAARQTGQLMEDEVQLREEELHKLDIQVQAGESSPFEMNQARLALNRARLARHDAETRAATALARLAAAVGVPSAAIAGVKLDLSRFASLPSDPGSAARRRALTHRADLLASLADYAGADAALRLEIARQYPNVTLSPGYELDQTDNKWTLGFSVELPVLNQNRGPIAEARAQRKKLGQAFEAQQSAVFGEIEIARAAYRAARGKVSIASKLSADAEQACRTTRNIVDAGELAPLELTRRKIEAVTASLALEEARIQARQAANDLEAAIQAPIR